MIGAFVIGVFAASKKFGFSFEIDVVDLLGIAVAVCVGFFLQNALTERSSHDRIEKDLILDQARSVLSALREITNAVQREARVPTTAKDRQDFVGKFRELGQDIHHLGCLLEEISIEVPIRELLGPVVKGHLDLKRAVTGGRFPNSPFDAKLVALVEKEARTFSSATFRLMCQVNRL